MASVYLVALLSNLGECRRDIGVLARDERVHHLHDFHIRPERFEKVPEFDRDIPATEYNQRLRLLAAVQCLLARHVINRVKAVDWRDERAAPGGDHDLLSTDPFSVDVDGSLVDEGRLVLV